MAGPSTKIGTGGSARTRGQKPEWCNGGDCERKGAHILNFKTEIDHRLARGDGTVDAPKVVFDANDQRIETENCLGIVEGDGEVVLGTTLIERDGARLRKEVIDDRMEGMEEGLILDLRKGQTSARTSGRGSTRWSNGLATNIGLEYDNCRSNCGEDRKYSGYEECQISCGKCSQLRKISACDETEDCCMDVDISGGIKRPSDAMKIDGGIGDGIVGTEELVQVKEENGTMSNETCLYDYSANNRPKKLYSGEVGRRKKVVQAAGTFQLSDVGKNRNLWRCESRLKSCNNSQLKERETPPLRPAEVSGNISNCREKGIKEQCSQEYLLIGKEKAMEMDCNTLRQRKGGPRFAMDGGKNMSKGLRELVQLVAWTGPGSVNHSAKRVSAAAQVARTALKRVQWQKKDSGTEASPRQVLELFAKTLSGQVGVGKSGSHKKGAKRGNLRKVRNVVDKGMAEPPPSTAEVVDKETSKSTLNEKLPTKRCQKLTRKSVRGQINGVFRDWRPFLRSSQLQRQDAQVPSNLPASERVAEKDTVIEKVGDINGNGCHLSTDTTSDSPFPIQGTQVVNFCTVVYKRGNSGYRNRNEVTVVTENSFPKQGVEAEGRIGDEAAFSRENVGVEKIDTQKMTEEILETANRDVDSCKGVLQSQEQDIDLLSVPIDSTESLPALAPKFLEKTYTKTSRELEWEPGVFMSKCSSRDLIRCLEKGGVVVNHPEVLSEEGELVGTCKVRQMSDILGSVHVPKQSVIQRGRPKLKLKNKSHERAIPVLQQWNHVEKVFEETEVREIPVVVSDEGPIPQQNEDLRETESKALPNDDVENSKMFDVKIELADMAEVKSGCREEWIKVDRSLAVDGSGTSAEGTVESSQIEESEREPEWVLAEDRILKISLPLPEDGSELEVMLANIGESLGEMGGNISMKATLVQKEVVQRKDLNQVGCGVEYSVRSDKNTVRKLSVENIAIGDLAGDETLRSVSLSPGAQVAVDLPGSLCLIQSGLECGEEKDEELCKGNTSDGMEIQGSAEQQNEGEAETTVVRLQEVPKELSEFQGVVTVCLGQDNELVTGHQKVETATEKGLEPEVEVGALGSMSVEKTPCLGNGILQAVGAGEDCSVQFGHTSLALTGNVSSCVVLEPFKDSIRVDGVCGSRFPVQQMTLVESQHSHIENGKEKETVCESTEENSMVVEPFVKDGQAVDLSGSCDSIPVLSETAMNKADLGEVTPCKVSSIETHQNSSRESVDNMENCVEIDKDGISVEDNNLATEFAEEQKGSEKDASCNEISEREILQTDMLAPCIPETIIDGASLDGVFSSVASEGAQSGDQVVRNEHLQENEEHKVTMSEMSEQGPGKTVVVALVRGGEIMSKCKETCDSLKSDFDKFTECVPVVGDECVQALLKNSTGSLLVSQLTSGEEQQALDKVKDVQPELAEPERQNELEIKSLSPKDSVCLLSVDTPGHSDLVKKTKSTLIQNEALQSVCTEVVGKGCSIPATGGSLRSNHRRKGIPKRKQGLTLLTQTETKQEFSLVVSDEKPTSTTGICMETSPGELGQSPGQVKDCPYVPSPGQVRDIGFGIRTGTGLSSKSTDFTTQCGSQPPNHTGALACGAKNGCTQLAIIGLKMCMSHILEDASAPYKSCEFGILSNSGSNCQRAVFQGNVESRYCLLHREHDSGKNLPSCTAQQGYSSQSIPRHGFQSTVLAATLAHDFISEGEGLFVPSNVSAVSPTHLSVPSCKPMWGSVSHKALRNMVNQDPIVDFFPHVTSSVEPVNRGGNDSNDNTRINTWERASSFPVLPPPLFKSGLEGPLNPCGLLQRREVGIQGASGGGDGNVVARGLEKGILEDSVVIGKGSNLEENEGFVGKNRKRNSKCKSGTSGCLDVDTPVDQLPKRRKRNVQKPDFFWAEELAMIEVVTKVGRRTMLWNCRSSKGVQEKTKTISKVCKVAKTVGKELGNSLAVEVKSGDNKNSKQSKTKKKKIITIQREGEQADETEGKLDTIHNPNRSGDCGSECADVEREGVAGVNENLVGSTNGLKRKLDTLTREGKREKTSVSDTTDLTSNRGAKLASRELKTVSVSGGVRRKDPLGGDSKVRKRGSAEKESGYNGCSDDAVVLNARKKQTVRQKKKEKVIEEDASSAPRVMEKEICKESDGVGDSVEESKGLKKGKMQKEIFELRGTWKELTDFMERMRWQEGVCGEELVKACEEEAGTGSRDLVRWAQKKGKRRSKFPETRLTHSEKLRQQSLDSEGQWTGLSWREKGRVTSVSGEGNDCSRNSSGEVRVTSLIQGQIPLEESSRCSSGGGNGKEEEGMKLVGYGIGRKSEKSRDYLKQMNKVHLEESIECDLNLSCEVGDCVKNSTDGVVKNRNDGVKDFNNGVKNSDDGVKNSDDGVKNSKSLKGFDLNSVEAALEGFAEEEATAEAARLLVGWGSGNF